MLYKRASRLFADLAQARGEGRLLRLMNTLERTNLIIIDDWGPEPLTADQRLYDVAKHRSFWLVILVPADYLVMGPGR